MFGKKGNKAVKSNAVKIIMAGMLVAYYVDYELVDAKLRKSQNLTAWSNEIIDSVHLILPNANVYVYPDFYRIVVITLPSCNEVQLIGKNIASHKHIGLNVKTYSYSTHFFDEVFFRISKQLFRRKEQNIKSIVLV